MAERDPSQPELRKDLVTGDWIILAAGRSRRPHELNEKRERDRSPKKTCPFEELRPEDVAPVIHYRNKKKKDWALQIIPNKYPLLTHQNVCSVEMPYGPYSYATGVGHHDVVITRDHDTNFAHLMPTEAQGVFVAFRERYHQLAADPCVNYFFALHNWGPKAGASIYHPHYQTVGMPIVPQDVHRSLMGSQRYFDSERKCPHCVMIDWERKKKVRVIFENDEAISFVPYAARFPFEIRVLPKKHLPYFEESGDAMLKGIASVMQRTLRALEKKLNDPDYNFYIHTAPIENKLAYTHYHWHVEILPKITTIASLEIGTGVEVNIVHPGDAAKLLRSR